MFLHSTHAQNPDMFSPNTDAIPIRLPMTAIWPRDLNSNPFLGLLRMRACRLAAAVLACASAICAVGGYGLPDSGSTRSAQSPTAKTPAKSGTSMCSLTTIFPRSILSIDLFIVLTGVTPAVQTSVLVRIVSSSPSSPPAFPSSGSLLTPTSRPSKLVTAVLSRMSIPCSAIFLCANEASFSLKPGRRAGRASRTVTLMSPLCVFG